MERFDIEDIVNNISGDISDARELLKEIRQAAHDMRSAVANVSKKTECSVERRDIIERSLADMAIGMDRFADALELITNEMSKG
jgi:type II secretory pathway component PulM